MRLDASPLQGITTCVYRSAHSRIFGGADRYFMPFFSPAREHLLTYRERRELEPAANAGVSAVPQVMTRRAEDFLWAAEELAAMGYREADLNLGCPSGTVVAKGKGAGFLARPDELDRFFEQVFSAPPPIAVSVKTRLGLREESEFPRLLEIYNRYPLSELIVHPRVQRDFYRRPVRRDAFAAALANCRLPLCYNGDLVTAADCRAAMERYPSLSGLMAGRGLIADPALFRKLRGGPPASREELERFTHTLYEGYRALYGSAGPAAQRMKELWYYQLRLFGESGRCARRMRRLSHPAEYESLEREIFRDLPLLTEPADASLE